MLTHSNPVSSNDGKIRYWWVANPYHVLTVTPADEDLQAATWFAHMDIDPNQTSTASPGPWFDNNIPCKPGLDYLRKTKDKHPSEVAICVDRSKQKNISATNIGGWYMMHGGSGANSKKGWKNELFGDGHCETRRFDQLRERWSPFTTGHNPQGW